MSETRVLLSALRELLDRCRNEVNEVARRSVWPLDAAIDQHLQVAERALLRLKRAVDSEECDVIAREVLSEVAHVRNHLSGQGVVGPAGSSY
jgi:hypothetical protein